MVENNNPNTVEVQEEKDAVTVYLEKESRKKIKLIVFFSIVAVAIIAVVLSFMLGKKEKDLKITSIKWDSSMKQVKSKCRAELETESDENLIYNYESVEGLKGPFTIYYSFENDKLTSVSAFVNDTLSKDLINKFNMQNVSFDGTRYYSEYNGYHLYLDNVLGFYITNDANLHDITVTYPTEDEMNEINRAMMAADMITRVTDPSTISDPEVFMEEFDGYINAICTLFEIHVKFPLFYEAFLTGNDLLENLGSWRAQATELANSLSSAERSNFIDSFNENIKKLNDAIRLVKEI